MALRVKPSKQSMVSAAMSAALLIWQSVHASATSLESAIVCMTCREGPVESFTSRCFCWAIRTLCTFHCASCRSVRLSRLLWRSVVAGTGMRRTRWPSSAAVVARMFSAATRRISPTSFVHLPVRQMTPLIRARLEAKTFTSGGWTSTTSTGSPVAPQTEFHSADVVSSSLSSAAVSFNASPAGEASRKSCTVSSIVRDTSSTLGGDAGGEVVGGPSIAPI
jgi:hypothetical protein